MANNRYDLSSIYTAADKYTVLQLLNALLDKVKDLEITDVDVDKTDVNKFKLVFTFADNTTMETPEFALEYDIVDVDIVNGHLIFTFDGDNTYDAGNLKGVTNFAINASQHLIVNYQDGTSQDLGAIFSGNVTISGNLSATGNISPLENICDNQGRNRFIEGSLSNPTISGLTRTYARWSLSGTHLMIVLAGTLAANTSLSFGTSLGAAIVPQWLADKIVPLISNKCLVTEQAFIRTNGGIERNNIAVAKYLNSLIIETYSNITYNDNVTFRFQFDLLIDVQ